MVTVLIADDHPVYRDGLASAIRAAAELELVAEAATAAEAVLLIMRGDPDVALVAPEAGSGARLFAQLRERGCRTRVVLLAGEPDGRSIWAGLEAGAAGYLSTRDDRAEICAALARAGRGDVVLSPEIQAALGRGLRRTGANGGLTEREHEVLELAAEGLSTTQMADRMFLSRATIKTHLAHVYAKLGASGKAAAVATGLRRRLID